MRIALVTPIMRSGERGGAEALYQGLLESMRAAGYAADQVEVPLDESTFDGILDGYLTCYDLDLGAYDLVVSTKAPTYMVRHPNHVSYLVHTIRVFYDMFAREFPAPTSDHVRQRALVHQLDQLGLHPERIRRHFANGNTTFQRLYDSDPFWRQIPFQALHHPPALDGFRAPRPGEYVLVPGRLHRWKRVDLVIQAYRHIRGDIPLKIVGTGEDEASLRELASGDPRIEFLGQVSDEELVDLYAGALVVPFVSQQEDYGLITIEAFKSQKPVITCHDSGEPTHFVRDGENGFVVDPHPRALAERLEYLVTHPAEATEMGRKGAGSISHVSWEAVVAALVSTTPDQSRSPGTGQPAAHPAPGPSRTDKAICPVSVLDMQPIHPPVGGGRLRLLGLFHDLGPGLPTTYRGTYDWPGEGFRTLRLSDTLEEITVPLSDAHFAAAEEWKTRAKGKTVIDVSFDLLAHHSADFIASAREGVRGAEIVIFEHPWAYPVVKDQLRTGEQLIVYNSENVEGFLRFSLLEDGGFGTELAKHVVHIERELSLRANLVLTCSHEDREMFHDLYGIPFQRMRVVPNGTFTRRIRPVDEATRLVAKRALGLPDRPLAVFVGSLYPPNLEAARFIADTLAPALPHVTFAICGGVGEADELCSTPPNVEVTGTLSEEAKVTYLAASNLAVNPMFSGSGTNIKMFDFMAAGLPVVSTLVGARGIATLGGRALRVVDPDRFVDSVRRLLEDPEQARELGASARRLVDEKYSWERLSRQLGLLLHRSRTTLHERAPFFSVVIPTYERHDRLWEVLECLSLQTTRDFEVIVVDQSSKPWSGKSQYEHLNLLYIHTDARGPAKARNMGAFYARGEVIAFTDDDCMPLPDWLAMARNHFEDPGVVGVEGLIVSDKVNDPAFRPVTNEGFEGFGFMTANLLIRHETFMAIDGFDEEFEHPFREDTDLGWRASDHGEVPFARDVRVYHPPHPRSVERESLAQRIRLFEQDAILLRKHPERYRTLFVNEGHYRHTKGFREHFLRGVARHGLELDDFYRSLLEIGDEEAVSHAA